MLQAVGDVRGKDAVDLGCGEGRFCRTPARRGARVTRIDLCETMIVARASAAPVTNTMLLEIWRTCAMCRMQASIWPCRT